MRLNTFFKLLLYKRLKDGRFPGPSPTDTTTSQQYNGLVDKVNNLTNVLFKQGYELFFTQAPTARSGMVDIMLLNAPSYVPLTDYYRLQSQIIAIENLLTVPGYAIVQVKSGDSTTPVVSPIPYSDDKYVSEEDFDVLKTRVEEVEAMLSNIAERLMLVPQ